MRLFDHPRRFRLHESIRRRGRTAFIRREGTRFGLAFAVVKSVWDVWSGPPASAAAAEWKWYLFIVTLNLLTGLASGYLWAHSLWAISERNRT